MRSAVGALCLAVLMTACAGTPSYYEWGPYSDAVWRATSGDGQLDIGADIDALNATVEKAAMGGKRVPPGMHAHIGMLYARRGELDTALAAFESEKELFPESAHFMDLLIGRIRGDGSDEVPQ